jgi:ABC-type transport system involved in cytochrome c biogenesis permease subunit
MPLEGISIVCFGASYAFALAFEIARLVREGKTPRILGTAFSVAGLFAHSVFLALRLPSLTTECGSLLFLAWILAVFYLFGSFHHARQIWSVFVLPVILGLIALAAVIAKAQAGRSLQTSYPVIDGKEFWPILHVSLFLLAAVGISVGFVASVMYLVQARRLKTKAPPRPGLRMLSLERLEAMNRRALTLAFPFLTAGLLVGTARMLQDQTRFQGWTDVRIVSTLVLWLVFAILFYLRFGLHLRGRRVAFMTIGAFVLLVVTLLTSHGQPAGGTP